MGSIMGYSGLNRDMYEGKRNKGIYLSTKDFFLFFYKRDLKSHAGRTLRRLVLFAVIHDGGEGNKRPMCKLGVRVNLRYLYWNRKRDWSNAYQLNTNSRGLGAASSGAAQLTENSLTGYEPCVRPSAASVWGLKLLVYEVFSYSCMRS